jgi:isoleucyl-tRNA synthetase
MFDEWTADASLTRIEEQVRRFWRRHDVPSAARREGPPFVLYQQPLAVAGQPPADQARLLVTADLFARYRTMRGEAVYRRAAWASHGLPVEVAVEATLGSAVAGYDLGQFNAACRQAAADGQRQGEALAERLGAWLGPEDTYDPLAPESVGAVWSALRRLWDAGRLRRQRRVVPVCPSCATPLSETEAARRAVEVEAQSAWLRLPWDGQPDAYLLAWTPAPWMLVGMVALAAHPDANYLLVELPGREDQPAARLLLAEALAKHLLEDRARVVRRLAGKALREARYHPPFTFLPAGDPTGRIVLSADVPLDRGSGLLPVTPSFDALSLALAQAHGLPLPDLLDDWGALNDAVTPWRGLSPLDATPLVVSNLEARGLLWQQQIEPRLQAQCPYCETPLLPQARDVWLVETASGPWVVGRDRAWGVPLPVWTCERCGAQLCIAGLDDLARRLGLEAGQIDPHRPAVDRLALPCEACGGTMRRVAEVIDTAFEAAVLPWATATQPGPADLAIGLGDEHLGWLGDLTEVSALLREALAWEQALALPEAEAGGSPQPLAPADAHRWATYTGTTPEQAERDFLQPVWRLAGELAGSRPRTALPLCQSEETRAFLDRWLAARLNQAGNSIAEALETHDPGRAAGALASLVNGLDRSFAPCRPGHGREVLETLSRLLAPFTPHLAEALCHLVPGREAHSVHLAGWPAVETAAADEALLARMRPVWRLAALGSQARARAALAPERRLHRAWVQLIARDPAEAMGLAPFHSLLAEVLGVDRVPIVEQAPVPVRWHLALDWDRAVQRRVVVDEIDAALAHLDPAAAAGLVLQLWSGLSVSLAVGDQAITLLPDEVRVSVAAPPGWAAAAEPGYLVLLEIG